MEVIWFKYNNVWWDFEALQSTTDFLKFTVAVAIHESISAARSTNDISIEFESQWKFLMLLFITYSADLNKISHTSR